VFPPSASPKSHSLLQARRSLVGDPRLPRHRPSLAGPCSFFASSRNVHAGSTPKGPPCPTPTYGSGTVCPSTRCEIFFWCNGGDPFDSSREVNMPLPDPFDFHLKGKCESSHRMQRSCDTCLYPPRALLYCFRGMPPRGRFITEVLLRDRCPCETERHAHVPAVPLLFPNHGYEVSR